MGVGAGAVSPVSYRPWISTSVAVYVGGGRLETKPVGVYCGKRDRGARAFEVVTGGRGYEEVAVGGMFPAPSPPVCQGG